MKQDFQMLISLLAYIVTFSGQLYFRRSYFLHSEHFLRTAASSEHNCYFLEQLFLQNGYFFWAATFLEKSFLHRNYFLRIATSQATFSKQLLLHNNDFYQTAAFSANALPQKRYVIKTATFWKKLFFKKDNISHYLFSRYIFKTYFSIAATFFTIRFSEAVLLHGYGSSPHTSYLSISD